MKTVINSFFICCCFLFAVPAVKAQTDMDAIMMGKGQLCIGPAYSYSSWTNYWEGTLKRENLNIGKVSTQMYSLMGAYGVSDKLNILFNTPYVTTKASAGTLYGMKGVQDLSLYVKWMPIEKEIGKGTFSLYTIGGLSIPLTNYVADYLPLSIGMRSKTASARLMLDYQVGNIFVTASGTYVARDNINIDRTSYYTDHLILSNEVEMPDASNFNFRAGYRSDKLIAEAVVNKWTTLGGFDISRNNMPFPSNRMNATAAGVNVKYVVTKDHALSIVAGGNTTVSGRNVGQSTTYYGSIFYVVEFGKKSKSSSTKPEPAKK
jgi:Putative MetA-pathway of phenol degradation